MRAYVARLSLAAMGDPERRMGIDKPTLEVLKPILAVMASGRSWTSDGVVPTPTIGRMAHCYEAGLRPRKPGFVLVSPQKMRPIDGPADRLMMVSCTGATGRDDEELPFDNEVSKAVALSAMMSRRLLEAPS